ncbi:MTH938/NDUFAF3 family protein [Thermodesulfobacteriota bacterium]
MNLLLRIILFISLFLFASCSSETTFTPTAGSQGPAITSYSFGKMIVDGKTYTNELQILPTGIVKKWSPSDPHYILPVDIGEIVNTSIKTLIIGNGANGEAAIPDETVKFLKAKNIRVHIMNTHEAVKLFNESSKEALGAIFHLNC